MFTISKFHNLQINSKILKKDLNLQFNICIKTRLAPDGFDFGYAFHFS